MKRITKGGMIMASDESKTYSSIANPYNNNLERSSSIGNGSVIPPSSVETAQTPTGSASTATPTAPANTTPLATPASIPGSSLTDLYLETFIKSRNYQPKVQGLYIDGRIGYIEAMDIYISGSIVGGSLDIPDVTTANSFHVDTAGNTWWGANVADGYAAANAYVLKTGVAMFKSGTVGGWTLGATTLTGTGVTMSSTGDAYLAIGTTPPTGVATGTGIFINKTGLFGLSANTQNFKIDATNGNITANAGTIGGFTITSTTLYGGIIKTAATVGAGTTGVIMDSTGLKGYDSVLGNTFSLPTDGSAPTFSSGIINETIFKISTNAVLRTSETVGDGSVDSAGVLINNTGMYGCVASQTLAGANIRILNIGTLFAGNNTNYFYWDGTYVRIKGNLDLTSIFNNISYLVSELPIPPTTEGFLSPTAYEY